MRLRFLFFLPLIFFISCKEDRLDWYNSFDDNFKGNTKDMESVVFWPYNYYPEHSLFGLLADQAIIELDEKLLKTYENDLLNFWPHAREQGKAEPFRVKKDKLYFLVRGVTFGPTQVYRVENSLLISSHIMTHHDVRPFKAAIVVEMDRVPEDVFMQVSAAE